MARTANVLSRAWRRLGLDGRERSALREQLADLERRVREAEERARKSERGIERERRKAEKRRRNQLKDETPQLVPLEYEGADIQLVRSSKLARKRRSAARKEPFTVRWIESLPAGDVLYDIGANVGPYALIAAKRPRGVGHVVAFEPGYASFATLCANIVVNDVADRVTPLPLMLGASTAMAVFEYSDLSAGAAHHGAGRATDVRTPYGQPMLRFALAELVERFQLPLPQHVKLDVDGAELDVLRGAEPLLDGVQSLMVELRDADQVEELLGRHGLRAQESHPRGAVNGEPFAYVLFGRS
jgi:FkbM family methyltransferase